MQQYSLGFFAIEFKRETLYNGLNTLKGQEHDIFFTIPADLGFKFGTENVLIKQKMPSLRQDTHTVYFTHSGSILSTEYAQSGNSHFLAFTSS